MAGCCVFTLRPRRYSKRKQDIQRKKFKYCLVVPDVTDLRRYSTAIALISAKLPKANQAINTSQITCLDRVVGGAEEAALRFLIDLEIQERVVNVRPCVAGCLAVTMGKVAWDLLQTNRSAMVKVKQNYPEIAVFKAAMKYRNSKFINVKKGESMVEVISPIPEMVAANLAAERHWCSNFKTLIGTEQEFRQMLFDMKGGLNEMYKAVKDEEDKAVIAVFQEAWNRTMGQLGGAATRSGSSFGRAYETRAERIRNEIMRARTADQLAKWFLAFCASATKGKPIDAFGDEATRKLVCKFIFDHRNFERFQNLCLFALVSYASDKPKTPKQGKE
jgi:CRISPR-associated protein Cas8a1/Csx13